MDSNQYKINYGEPWVPDGFWHCANCGATVQNGETHTCSVGVGCAQIYTASDRDLLLQILSQLKEIINLLKYIKERK